MDLKVEFEKLQKRMEEYFRTKSQQIDIEISELRQTTIDSMDEERSNFKSLLENKANEAADSVKGTARNAAIAGSVVILGALLFVGYTAFKDLQSLQGQIISAQQGVVSARTEIANLQDKIKETSESLLGEIEQSKEEAVRLRDQIAELRDQATKDANTISELRAELEPLSD